MTADKFLGKAGYRPLTGSQQDEREEDVPTLPTCKWILLRLDDFNNRPAKLSRRSQEAIANHLLMCPTCSDESAAIRQAGKA